MLKVSKSIDISREISSTHWFHYELRKGHDRWCVPAIVDRDELFYKL